MLICRIPVVSRHEIFHLAEYELLAIGNRETQPNSVSCVCGRRVLRISPALWLQEYMLQVKCRNFTFHPKSLPD